MDYKIPSDVNVEKALRNVFRKVHTVPSQNKLKELVTEELSSDEERFGVSPSRLRKIAISSDFIDLEIHSREGDPKKIMSRCPVCEKSLHRVRNFTIWGGKVTIEFRCSNCGYWTGKRKRIPTRYIFHYSGD